MNKYEEAFNKSIKLGFVSESEYSIIKEAIEKAEKYDEIMKIENSLNGGSIRSGKKPYALQILIERDEALKRCEELEKENAELLKANSFNNDIVELVKEKYE